MRSDYPKYFKWLRAIVQPEPRVKRGSPGIAKTDNSVPQSVLSYSNLWYRKQCRCTLHIVVVPALAGW